MLVRSSVLGAAADFGKHGPRRKVELKNCQSWMRESVVVEIERGIFPADALVELDMAPKD
jgi:hypothetical protein